MPAVASGAGRSWGEIVILSGAQKTLRFTNRNSAGVVVPIVGGDTFQLWVRNTRDRNDVFGYGNDEFTVVGDGSTGVIEVTLQSVDTLHRFGYSYDIQLWKTSTNNPIGYGVLRVLKSAIDPDDAAIVDNIPSGVTGFVVGTGLAYRTGIFSDLSTLLGVSPSADKLPYYTGTASAALTSLTSFGRQIVGTANAGALQTLSGLVIGTNVQAYDATLAALADQNWVVNAIPIGTGADTVAQTPFAANTFLARGSTGNLAAKPITDAGLAMTAAATASAQAKLLGVATDDSPTFAAVKTAAIYNGGLTLAIDVQNRQLIKDNGISAALVWSGSTLQAGLPISGSAASFSGLVQAGTFSGAATGLTGTAASLTAGTASAAPASGLTGGTLASGVTVSSLTSVGTLGSLVVSGSGSISCSNGTSSEQFGSGATTSAQPKCLAMGAGATITVQDGLGQSMAIGPSATAYGHNAVAIGYNANASSGADAFALGTSSVAGPSGVSVGTLTTTGTDGVAVGLLASATGSRSVAIGKSTNDGGFQQTVTIGYSAIATRDGQFVWCSRDFSSPQFIVTTNVSDFSIKPQYSIDSSWVSNTPGSQKARVTISAWDTAAREAVRIEASGSAAMVGFFGANAVVQQSGDIGAALVALGLMSSTTLNLDASKTIVNGSGSGTATFSQPIAGASLKRVLIYCNALLGTASYTFPTAFSIQPSVIATNDAAAGVVTSRSTTAVTVTGTTTTGFIELVGY